jgi:purine catabolism regulator
VRVGAGGLADACEEARYALLGCPLLLGGPGVVAYDELGSYRYLLRIALDPRIGDSTIDAVSRIAAYDRRRRASLLHTLEEFLAHRGAVGATSEALFVHPNTLRQRLARIGEISGIDLGSDDWLAVEIAVKLVRVRTALGMGGLDT